MAISHARKNTQDPSAIPTDSVLTRAETRIACGYVDGLIGKEIAHSCGVSYNTVVRHTQTNCDIDRKEFRRRLGATLLLLLISAQTAFADFDSNLVRRFPSRKVEMRKGAARRSRREEEQVFDFSTILLP